MQQYYVALRRSNRSHWIWISYI